MPRVLTLVALVLCLPLLLSAATPPTAWLDHVQQDLARFWMDARYHGDPVGSFPTFIGPDGAVWDPANPSPSLADAPEWISSELGRQYLRMVSRQTFTYGVIFHLTGDAQALALARAGAQYIIQHGHDPDTGSVATYIQNGNPDFDPAARTTQSLAYGLLGPAFLYYLTGDPELLAFIQTVKDHVFHVYWDRDRGELRWSNAEGEDRRELVAQLDQVNAYLLLLTPLLSADQQRDRWEFDLRRLADAMMRDYHDPQRQRFCGYLHAADGCRWGARHNDFGHTTKAYWMLERTGVLLGDATLTGGAREGLADVLQTALVRRHLRDAPPWQQPVMARAAAADSTYWIWSNQPDGIGIDWWEWAELDQAAYTMALTDPRWLETLDRVLPTWFTTMVDPASGAVLSFPGALQGPRAHHWLNGYHAAEHALVGYILSSRLAGERWRLYYAPASADHPLRAYYFEGDELERHARKDGAVQVWFTAPSP